MPDPLVQTVTVTGDRVRPGDVIAVGGIPHAVEDVRELVGNRKRLQFADGNAYVLGRSITVEVTRTYIPVHGRPHTPQRPRSMAAR
ncbi:hypothetical protein JK364_41690 [Streptomyces sp. 110]|uniref:Uncharacterized protein n=1 Tax=Streptomyces endocoffeicus TaxID=2898945 RepID=A0ABS1Q2E1_9ACTN|nr:hypothetical protein [Streptomyces endocoffeicus]MBL1118831.1 hypothetical protein [Streptomyces endocoffeicus]